MPISKETKQKCKAYGITKRGSVILLDLLSQSRGYSRRRDIVCKEAENILGSGRIVSNGLSELTQLGFVKETVTANHNTQLQITKKLWNRALDEIKAEHDRLLSLLTNNRRWKDLKKTAAKARKGLAQDYGFKIISYKATQAHLDLIIQHTAFERDATTGNVRFNGRRESNKALASSCQQDMPLLGLSPGRTGRIPNPTPEPKGHDSIEITTEHAPLPEERTAAFKLPDLPDDDWTDNVPQFDNDDVDHDPETLALLGVMVGTEGGDATDRSTASEAAAISEEATDDILARLETHLAALGGSGLKVKRTLGRLTIETAQSGRPFVCSVKHRVESSILTVRAFLPLVKEAVWDILQMTGEDGFSSTLGTAIQSGAQAYVVRQDVNIKTHSEAEVAQLILQLLSEAAELNELIQEVSSDS